jgi:hypothetical protein
MPEREPWRPLGYGRYADDPAHIGCPRAKTDMTPCVARDGECSAAHRVEDHPLAGQVCVGCGLSPSDLLRDIVRHVTEAPAREVVYLWQSQGWQPGDEGSWYDEDAGRDGYGAPIIHHTEAKAREEAPYISDREVWRLIRRSFTDEELERRRRHDANLVGHVPLRVPTRDGRILIELLIDRNFPLPIVANPDDPKCVGTIESIRRSGTDVWLQCHLSPDYADWYLAVEISADLASHDSAAIHMSGALRGAFVTRDSAWDGAQLRLKPALPPPAPCAECGGQRLATCSTCSRNWALSPKGRLGVPIDPTVTAP